MHPSHHARSTPEKAAYIIGTTGEVVTYGELDQRSNQGAHLFRSLGLRTGDVIALLMDNNARFFEIVWAAQRSGLYYACISSRLAPAEAAYIVQDSGAKILVTSNACMDLAAALAPLVPGVELIMTGGAVTPYRSFEDERAAHPSTPIIDEIAGSDMLYSSGTTGRPKGIKPPLSGHAIDVPTPLVALSQKRMGFTPDSVYLSPAPLYHAAPLRWSVAMHRLGGTVIVMEKFDEIQALELIERYRVTESQWVPTHFVRLLKLPEEVRCRFDLSSLRTAVHAAAPCPVAVKEAMIDWWGPILLEYYSGTENFGMTIITSEEWLEHKGSVGRALLGKLHICDEAGDSLPPRTEGMVFFENDTYADYHNAPEKRAETRNRHGWATFGDVGWTDEEGYLYLTDRKSFMIISGGVNIYPQEIEDLLLSHAAVADVAVVGAPHSEWGEQVVAVIQPTDWNSAGDALASELVAFARANLSGFKVPRKIEFCEELPRLPTGKLMKRLIRDRYWATEPVMAAQS